MCKPKPTGLLKFQANKSRNFPGDDLHSLKSTEAIVSFRIHLVKRHRDVLRQIDGYRFPAKREQKPASVWQLVRHLQTTL